MAYNSANLHKMYSTIAGGFAMFDYNTSDAVTAVRVTGYVTDALKRGLKKGDLVIVRNASATPPTLSFNIVSAINANGSGDLSDGTAVTATNTD